MWRCCFSRLIHCGKNSVVYARGDRVVKMVQDTQFGRGELAAMLALMLHPHPHIAPLLGFDARGGSLCFSLPRAACDMFDMSARRGRLSEKDAAVLLGQMCSALVHLHRVGYAHRDVKLENWVIARSGEVMLIDFGFAQPLQEPYEAMCGSEHYIAPELWRASGGTPARIDLSLADLWSLGICLYALLFRHFPFSKAAEEDEHFSRFAQTGLLEPSAQLKPETRSALSSLLSLDASARSAVACHAFVRSARGRVQSM